MLYVAFIGITALLLLNGCTSHTQFKIPINLIASTYYSVTYNLQISCLLKEASLIIQDEVLMQYKYYFKVVHQLLCNLQGVTDNVMFSSIPILLSGDFAQILPIVLNGSQSQIVHACLQCSFVQLKLQQLHLRVNMHVYSRLHNEEFVSQIG